MISIDARFNGPPDSGNGGYCSGVFASFVDTSGPDAGVEVTLRRPPPLDTPLTVEREVRAAVAELGVVGMTTAALATHDHRSTLTRS